MDIQTLLLIMVIVWGTGMVFRKLKLPILLGELLAGLIFGPALFGVFQDSETIQILAELGIFFLMLHAGLETQPKDLIKSSKTSLAMAFGGMAIPMLFGYLISKEFGYSNLQAIFIGLGLSTTAISITTKIFRDFKFNKSKVAHLVMGAAIISDITAFVILSVILGVLQDGAIEITNLMKIIGEVLLFFGVTLLAGTKLVPTFQKLFQKKGYKAFTFTLVLALAFGTFAEFIGLHYILGAYLAGLFLKEENLHPDIYKKIEDRLFGLSYSFLGPIFFVSLGFRVDFSIFQETETIGFLILITLGAIVGKVVGAGLMARLAGNSKEESMLIGVSMNGRGTVELIIALIGLEWGLIDEKVFSVLVFMAFAATLITPITLKTLLRLQGKKELMDSEYSATV